MAKSTYHPSIPAEHQKHFGAIVLSAVNMPGAACFHDFIAELNTKALQWSKDPLAQKTEEVGVALAFWLMYPLILELVCNTSPIGTDEEKQRLAKTKMLMGYIHGNATTIIINWAEREGINSKSIFRSAQLCLKMTGENPFLSGTMFPGKRFDSWPHCLGPGLNGLSDAEREIVLDADASIAQLNARVNCRTATDDNASGQADTSADTKRKKSIYVPRNKEVLQLAQKLEKEKNTGQSKRDIAFVFAEENGKKAASLLRGVRRYRERNA